MANIHKDRVVLTLIPAVVQVLARELHGLTTTAMEARAAVLHIRIMAPPRQERVHQLQVVGELLFTPVNSLGEANRLRT